MRIGVKVESVPLRWRILGRRVENYPEELLLERESEASRRQETPKKDEGGVRAELILILIVDMMVIRG